MLNLPKIFSRRIIVAAGALLMLMCLGVQAQNPVITSFSFNGSLTCSNLAPGSTAVVEWASSPSGPWRTNWNTLEAVNVGTNGVINVLVPMFYRVRGVAAAPATNRPPVAVDDNEAVAANTSLVRAASVFLANDIDPDGQTLTLVSVSNATNGNVLLSAGTVIFTPQSGFTGIATFNYTVSEGTLTDTGVVTIVVGGN
ncbi:MAG: Ig-like domain-containing protein [Verrucomicrobiota bacterium]